MSALLNLPAGIADRRLCHGFFEDFDEGLVTGDRWTTLVADVADGGATAIATIDGAGGILSMSPEDSTDEDEVGLEYTREAFKFAENKPLLFEARVQFAQANTNKGNIFVGLADAPGANLMVDAGAGPKTSFSGAAFFSVDGGTNWRIIASLSTTQDILELTALNSLDNAVHVSGSSSYQVLRIEFAPFSSTQAYLDYYIDGVHVAHRLYTFTSATEMSVAFGVKNGSTTAETMKADYVLCFQKR